MSLELVNNFAELKSIPAPHFEDEQPYNWDCWLSIKDGSFICTKEYDDALKMLLNHGVIQEVQNTRNDSNCTANIGFNPTEQKWYGWSHRAIFGFGVGSTCKKGDTCFIPSNKEEDIECQLSFWDSKYRKDISFIEVTNDEGVKGLQITSVYTEEVPNKELRGKVYEIFTPLLTKYGRGEWIAESLEDAKQMAIDFAESIS